MCIHNESSHKQEKEVIKMKEINNDFEHYICEYKERLSKLCCSLCRNYADADDLFQETWLKAMNGYESFDKSRDFGKWLFSICVNTYKNKCRTEKRVYHFNTAEEKEIFLASLPDTTVKNEKYDELVEQIRELPEKYRTVLALRYFNSYSEKDVAQILNIPVGTVKSRLNKAKELLRRRLSL